MKIFHVVIQVEVLRQFCFQLEVSSKLDVWSKTFPKPVTALMHPGMSNITLNTCFGACVFLIQPFQSSGAPFD